MRAGAAGLMAAVVGILALTLALASVLPSSGATVAAKAAEVATPAIGLQPDAPVAMTATPPPWNLPVDARPYIAAAGLETSAAHGASGFEAHLDVFDGRRRIPVAADIGHVLVSGAPATSSPVRTDDGSGVVHVAGSGRAHFTLGQLFTEWGVPLSSTQVGGFTTGGRDVLRTFVNGRAVVADPTTVPLASHAEIELWYGPASAHPHVVSAYRFS